MYSDYTGNMVNMLPGVAGGRITYMFIVNRFGEKADDHRDGEANEKEDNSEVKVMYVGNYPRSIVLLRLSTWRHSVRVFPDKSYQAHD